MKKLPIFILASYDSDDEFAKKRLFELKIDNELILEYLIRQIRESQSFSEIYLVGPKKLRAKFSKKCFFIKGKKSLEKNFKIIYSITNRDYGKNAQIAVISSDIMPSANDFQKLLSVLAPFLDNDLILICAETKNIRVKKGEFFLKKDREATPVPYAGGGDFFIIRPSHLREKLIYFLTKILRPIRKIVRKRGLKGLKIFLIFIKLIQTLIRFPWLKKELILFFKTFRKYQKENLIFKEVEEIYSKIFVKEKYQKPHKSSCHIEIINIPSFIEDIDTPEDFEILKKLKEK